MPNSFRRKYNRVLQSPFIKGIIEWSKKTSIPGFKGVPVYYVTTFFISEIQKEKITIRSNSIAFSFFLALFPFLIFLITLVSFLNFRSVQEYLDSLHDSIAPVLPESVDRFIFNVIDGIFQDQRGDLLSLSVILAFYFASNGVLNLMAGFEKKYESYSRRNLIKKRLLALGLTFFLGVLTIVGLSLLLLSQDVISKMLDISSQSGFNQNVLIIARALIIFLLFYSTIAILYRYGPNLKRKSAYFSPGANFATVGIIVTSLAFGFYLNRFNNYNAIYGSLGAIIITLLWIKINATIILIGYELNASIAVNRILVEQDPSSTT